MFSVQGFSDESSFPNTQHSPKRDDSKAGPHTVAPQSAKSSSRRRSSSSSNINNGADIILQDKEINEHSDPNDGSMSMELTEIIPDDRAIVNYNQPPKNTSQDMVGDESESDDEVSFVNQKDHDETQHSMMDMDLTACLGEVTKQQADSLLSQYVNGPEDSDSDVTSKSISTDKEQATIAPSLLNEIIAQVNDRPSSKLLPSASNVGSDHSDSDSDELSSDENTGMYVV